MRAMWSGAVSFGLVNIPIRLYSATEDHGLNFHMLHKKDMSPIRYVRVCKEEGEEVQMSDIVKGYEYERGQYIVVTDEDFEKASPRKTKTIDIIDFVSAEEIDPIYFEKPYYLEADKGGDKAYSLLREALERSNKVGIAKYVLRNREALGLVRPFGKLLVLDQMRFDHEIREPEGLKESSSDVQDREVGMALALIEQLTETFDPKRYRDTYEEELLHLIQQKIEGKEPEEGEPAPTVAPVTDLVALLKASLDQPKKEGKAKTEAKDRAVA
jgi:DNA end-binding protein Ku